MGIYNVNFKRSTVGDGWTSSVAKQTEDPRNPSQVALGESEITNGEEAINKIRKRLSKTDFTKDEIRFNGVRQKSLDDLIAAVKAII